MIGIPIHSEKHLTDLQSGTKRETAIRNSLAKIERNYPHSIAGLRQGIHSAFGFTENSPVDLKPNSNLTNMGVPLEWAMVWPGNRLRTTVDVLPGGTVTQRLARSLSLCGNFDFPIQQEIMEEVMAWEYGTKRKYGAWLGIRDRDRQPNYKLYVEVPELTGKQPWPHTWVKFDQKLAQEGNSLMMIGLQADTGVTEFYFRSKSITKPGLALLLKHFQFPDYSRKIIEAVQLLRRRTIRYEIPSVDIGFSLSFNADYWAEAFTLYSFSGSLMGRDKSIRQQILEFGRQKYWDLSLYEELSQGLETAPYDINTWHGMVGFTIGRHGSLSFNVGLSPIITR